MDRTYLPILLLLGFVIANAVMMLGALATSRIRRPHIRSRTRRTSPAFRRSATRSERFSVKFYMVAMLFIVFDIETVFMIPWGAYFRQLSCAVPLVDGVVSRRAASRSSGSVRCSCSSSSSLVGFVYVWKKGALQWD